MTDFSRREALESMTAPKDATGRRPVTEHKARFSRATTPQMRDNEWLFAWIMLGWGIVLQFPGDSLSGPNFAAFHAYPFMTEKFWSFMFGSAGVIRLVSLYVNGRSPRTPYGRMVGAIFGFFAWLTLALLILKSSVEQLHAFPTGTVVYFSFVVAEGRTILRAGYDARYQPRTRR